MRDWLFDLRKQKGLTCKEFGKLLGMTEPHYWNIENGYRKARMDVALLAKIATATDEDFYCLMEKELAHEHIHCPARS